MTRHSRCGPTSRARTSSRASGSHRSPARREARCGPRSSLPLDVLLARAGELLDAIALLPVDRALLLSAGALAEPALPALDAIHVAAAIDVSPVDAFLSYDERQSVAARLAGLGAIAPGA